jgi:hypothetical protein
MKVVELIVCVGCVEGAALKADGLRRSVECPVGGDVLLKLFSFLETRLTMCDKRLQIPVGLCDLSAKVTCSGEMTRVPLIKLSQAKVRAGE